MKLALTVCCVSILIVSLAKAQTSQPQELGHVQWLHDLDQAIASAKQTDKPILLLFQEIPGCETCRTFGDQPLSHPLLVEAMESLFVPVAIYNNREGRDAEILASFKEPSWNNPVIRFINAEQNDIIPRKDRVWTTSGVSQRMTEALKAAQVEVPSYLKLVSLESQPGLEQATFAMHCFWEGEGKLGGLDGVVSTSAAWADGKEVVHVRFDPQKIEYGTLLERAQSLECASTVFASNERQMKIAKELVGDRAKLLTEQLEQRPAKPSDRHYYLRNSKLGALEMTPMQATKINAGLHMRATRDQLVQWLSPRQISQLAANE